MANRSWIHGHVPQARIGTIVVQDDMAWEGIEFRFASSPKKQQQRISIPSKYASRLGCGYATIGRSKLGLLSKINTGPFQANDAARS
jgi:hypothetical protein